MHTPKENFILNNRTLSFSRIAKNNKKLQKTKTKLNQTHFFFTTLTSMQYTVLQADAVLGVIIFYVCLPT